MKEESLLLLSDLQKLINQVVLIDYTIIILGGAIMADNKFSRSQSLMASCVPMTKLQSVIGGKWKILIMWYISVYKVQRLGELQRRIGNEITKSTLTKQLRELENDGWINRQIYQEIPPRVEYTLTELAESFVPILEQMKEWSETHLC